MDLYTAIVESPIGWICLKGTQSAIHALTFIDNFQGPEILPNELKFQVSELLDYFKGKTTTFSFQFNADGTSFQKKVWSFLHEIPYEKTVSYKEIAVLMGDPNSVRAVANAIAKNPILIIIPCHRVIGTNGKLTGYAGGLDRKKWLLQHEKKHKQYELF